MLEYLSLQYLFIDEQDRLKLLLSSFSIQQKGRPNLILGIAETFLNDSWSDASLAEAD